jgi:hypothetical protein
MSGARAVRDAIAAAAGRGDVTVGAAPDPVETVLSCATAACALRAACRRQTATVDAVFLALMAKLRWVDARDDS